MLYFINLINFIIDISLIPVKNNKNKKCQQYKQKH
jgi:hypothetical protein